MDNLRFYDDLIQYVIDRPTGGKSLTRAGLRDPQIAR